MTTTLTDLQAAQRNVAKAKYAEQQAIAAMAPLQQAARAAMQATQAAQLALEQCLQNIDPTIGAAL